MVIYDMSSLMALVVIFIILIISTISSSTLLLIQYAPIIGAVILIPYLIISFLTFPDMMEEHPILGLPFVIIHTIQLPIFLIITHQKAIEAIENNGTVVSLIYNYLIALACCCLMESIWMKATQTWSKFLSIVLHLVALFGYVMLTGIMYTEGMY